MTEDEVIKIVGKHVEKLFPMVCSTCNHRFASLKEYLEDTIPIGKPISYDAERGDWKPLKPLGTFSLRNCQCGTTLSLSSHGMRIATLWRLLRWLRKESSSRGINMREGMEDIRKKSNDQVLNQKYTELNSQINRMGKR